MEPTTNKLMRFFQTIGKIDGRIKLQKVIYILQEKGCDFDLYFKYALYGPYSADLQLEIDFLKKIKFLKEEKSDGNNYKYVLNDKFHSDLPKLDEKYLDLISLLLSKESQLLEVTSTIYYLKNQRYDSDISIKEKIEILKPNLAGKIPNAFELYHNIESIEYS
jgi:uncharacterized protein YwgA